MAASSFHLNLEEIKYKEFCNASTDADKWRCLCESSTIKYATDNNKSQIFQEYLFHNLYFCYENSLTFEQASNILRIVENFMNTCFLNQKYTEELCIQYFREQVDHILLAPVQNDVIVLEVTILEKFLLFFVNNFIRHLLLYQTVFMTQQPEVIQHQNISIQTPFAFPSLMEALPGDVINKQGSENQDL